MIEEIFTFNGILYTIAPAALSCLASLWIAYRYINAVNKTVGLTMILILAISDFFFDLGLLIFKILDDTFTYLNFYKLIIIPLYFAIFWATAMSFLVYMSLQNKDFESKKTLLLTFFITLLLTVACYLYWTLNTSWSNQTISFGLAPVSISLLVTFGFYAKSIHFLHNSTEYQLRSTKLYIRNLWFYSLSQILTLGPLILYPFILEFCDFSGPTFKYLWRYTKFLAALTGFINGLIFSFQGSSNNEKPIVETDSDLSHDLI